MKKYLLALALSAALLTGCAAQNPAGGTTTPITTPYGIASRLADDVALSVNNGDALVDAWRVQGLLTATEERNILGWSNLVNVVNAQYIGCVRVAHTQSKVGGLSACAKSLASGIGDPATLDALHVTNPKSQANVTQMANAITGLVTAAITALGGN
jgi:hypothetical protein